MTVFTKQKLSRSTAQEIRFQFYNESTGAVITSAANITGTRTLWGGTPEATGGSLVEIGNGRYAYTTDSTDTALRWVNFTFSADNAEDVNIEADCGYPQTWDEIQADLDNAPDGSTVELEPNLTYTQNYAAGNIPLRIKKSVTLEGHNATINHTRADLILVQSDWSQQIFWHPTQAFDPTNNEGTVHYDVPEQGVIPATGTNPAKGDVSLSPGTSITGAVSDGDIVYVQLGRAVSHGGAEPQWARMVHLVSLNQKQLIFLDSTGAGRAGNFSLTFGGDTTASIAHDATAASVETALTGLTSIGYSGVAVTHDTGYGPATTDKAWLVEFSGTGFAQTNQSLITLNDIDLTDYDATVTEKYSALTIDRPVEFTIHTPTGNNPGGNDHRYHHRLYVYNNVAKNVTIRNLGIGIDRSYDVDMIPDRTIDVQQAINVVIENLDLKAPLGITVINGAENVVIRNITQFGQVYRAQNYHGRILGGWSQSNLIGENLICTTDNTQGDGVFMEAQNNNVKITNTQGHCIKTTTGQIWYPVGSTLGGTTASQLDNVILENVTMNAPTGSITTVGSIYARTNSASAKFRNFLARNTNTLLRHDLYDDMRIHDDQTSPGTNPPVDRYHIYDQSRMVTYVTRISLTGSYANQDFTIGKGLAVANLGIYTSSTSGITKCQVKTGAADSSAYNILSSLSGGAWIEPDDVTDIYPANDLSLGYPNVLNRYVDSNDETKQLRISTNADVPPSAYMLVAATCFANEQMAMNEPSGVTVYSTATASSAMRRRGTDDIQGSNLNIGDAIVYIPETYQSIDT